MFSRIYLAALGLSIAVATFFAYYSWSWLQSIGQPAAAIAGYEYHADLAWPFLVISFLILLAMGNAILWASGRSWAIWTTLSYFVVLLIVRSFWLDQMFRDFKVAANVEGDSFSTNTLTAAALIVAAVTLAFLDQLVVVKLRAKTFGEDRPQPEHVNAGDSDGSEDAIPAKAD